MAKAKAKTPQSIEWNKVNTALLLALKSEEEQQKEKYRFSGEDLKAVTGALKNELTGLHLASKDIDVKFLAERIVALNIAISKQNKGNPAAASLAFKNQLGGFFSAYKVDLLKSVEKKFVEKVDSRINALAEKRALLNKYSALKLAKVSREAFEDKFYENELAKNMQKVSGNEDLAKALTGFGTEKYNKKLEKAKKERNAEFSDLDKALDNDFAKLKEAQRQLRKKKDMLDKVSKGGNNNEARIAKLNKDLENLGTTFGNSDKSKLKKRIKNELEDLRGDKQSETEKNKIKREYHAALNKVEELSKTFNNRIEGYKEKSEENLKGTTNQKVKKALLDINKQYKSLDQKYSGRPMSTLVENLKSEFRTKVEVPVEKKKGLMERISENIGPLSREAAAKAKATREASQAAVQQAVATAIAPAASKFPSPPPKPTVTGAAVLPPAPTPPRTKAQMAGDLAKWSVDKGLLAVGKGWVWGKAAPSSTTLAPSTTPGHVKRMIKKMDKPKQG